LRIDFYQLGGAPAESIVATLAGKLLEEGQRLLVVAGEDSLLARLDRLLWDQGASSFIPHGLAGGTDDSAQPILLSAGSDAPNRARNVLVADGKWREAVLAYDRAFHLFDADSLTDARLAWKLLAGRDAVERHYWGFEDGRWVEKA
jgi:DNA polymerase-3 subunit chi